ncbi:MAG: hypothetical protein NTZ53_13300 [Cyanobacteria bacterium]|nr:hypothetical protein [Cyanobacteriota bacterium]
MAEAAKDATVDSQDLFGLIEIAQAFLDAKCLIVGVFNSQEWNNHWPKHSLWIGNKDDCLIEYLALLSGAFFVMKNIARLSAIHPLPMTLWVLLLLSGLLVACKGGIISEADGLGKGFSSASRKAVEAGRNFFSCGQLSACPRNYVIENGLVAAKKKAIAVGLSSISVDLNQFTHRKIKKICLQTYAMWGIGSEEQQQQEFEKDAGESLGKSSNWHKEGEIDSRIVIFFIRGEPLWFEIPDREGLYLGKLKSLCTISSFVLLSESKEPPFLGLTSHTGRPGIRSDWTIQWSESQ